MPASGGFPHSPGQPGFHFPAGRASAPAPAGTPHCHRLRRRTAEGYPRGCGAAFRLLTGSGFNPDEWREAPRLINRLDAGSVVLWSGGRRPGHHRSLAVSVTATSARQVPFRRHTRFATTAAQRVIKDSGFRPAALHIVRV